MKPISVAIIEDVEDIRNSLQMLLAVQEGIDLTDAYEDGETALDALSRKPVDVALFDIQLPGISGIEAITRLKARHPAMQFMVLTAYEDADYIFKALRAGATGYMLKSTPPDKLVDCIKDLYAGGSPMSSQIARKVVAELASFKPAVPQTDGLSRRENEILAQLAKGFRYKEIAERLFISVETVRTHIRNIYEKLQVASRMEALKKAGIV